MIQLAKDSLDVGLVVADVDASLDFYCGVLGFPKGDSVPIPGNRTLHHINVGSSVLKLQELHDGAPAPGPRGITAQVGVRYITLWVHDISDAVRDLEGRGFPFALPLHVTAQGQWMAMLEDPDGNIVELMQLPTAGEAADAPAGQGGDMRDRATT